MGILFDDWWVGQRFRTPGRTITTADIGAFAGLTGDYNPVHTDEVFARATDFGQCVAHGPMGIGLAFGLASRLDLIDGTVIALLGVTWDFKAPMRPGDTIRAEIEVIEARPVTRGDRGLIGWSIVLANQADLAIQQGTARLLMRRTALAEATWGPV